MLFRLLRFGFRLLPLDDATRDRWRQRFLARHAGLVPPGPKGRLRLYGRRRARVHMDEAAIGHIEHRHEALPSPLPATVVAFYLPQFHPIPQNDEWWGAGFTEWRNVGRALPQFEGHAQPRLPADLGYYNLRNAETMRAQAALAAEYGIGAFCFYYYWFSGTTLLEQPLRTWLADPSLQLPFCLCWGNESWSRRWDGRSEDILMAQRHDAADDLAFIAHVAQYLRDPRYLRVDGRPLLLVYRPGLLPDAAQTASRWREWCRSNGVGEIHIACVQGFERPDPRDIGFDSAVEFPPNLATPANLTERQRLLNPDFAGEVLDWRELADDYRGRPPSPYPLSPSVNCGWDNEPRRAGRGRVYLHSSPRGYRDWLRETIRNRLEASPGRLVFVNAWNEWAEGAVLEPDVRLGHAWLQATRNALREAAGIAPAPGHVRPCVVVHAWHLEALDEIFAALLASGLSMRLLVTTAPEKAEEVHAALSRSGLHAEVEVFENRGRDILPFLHVANRLLDEGEEIVLKLHTKHSPHRSDGDRWRRELLDRLLAPARAARIFQAFERDRGLGMVAPEGHVQPLHYFWGANQDNVDYAATRMGIAEPNAESDRFVSGSMFWARLEALRPLLDTHFDPWEFEREAGQVDGTFAHAIERVFALSAHHCGLRVEEAAVVCGEPAVAVAPGAYPYAARG